MAKKKSVNSLQEDVLIDEEAKAKAKSDSKLKKLQRQVHYKKR